MSKKSAHKTDLRNGLYFIPLGGSEQFGVNLNVYAVDGELLAVDCGIGFADERLPGIDIILPDPAFLEGRVADLKGLIITHAHEDHVGAVAYLWKRFKCPIYTTPFTAAVLNEKFREADVRGAQVIVCKPMKMVEIGPFKTQFIPVSHSIPDACALFIETKYGNVLHSGDWNLDPSPVVSHSTNPKVFQEIGDKGVLAYIGDSTNAEVPGRAGSESETEAGLIAEFKKCKGRIAVTIFSSNIGRIVSIVNAGRACGREVGVIGRSLHKMIAAAHATGYLNDLPEFFSEEEISKSAADKVLLIATGSQGEARSALAKIARGEFNGVSLTRGDTVVFSARPIPGNEKNINVVKNNLSGGGINVVTPLDTNNTIHVSGHPCRDELADMYKWVRPKLVIPVHGERMQLDAQARFAQECGVGQTIVPSNGSVIKLAPGTPETVDRVETGTLAVDAKRVISAWHSSIGERRKLQYSGAVHVSLVLGKRNEIMGEPKLDTVGLFDLENKGEQKIEDKLYHKIYHIMEELTPEEIRDDQFVEEELRIGLRRFVHDALGIKPKVTAHILRI